MKTNSNSIRMSNSSIRPIGSRHLPTNHIKEEGKPFLFPSDVSYVIVQLAPKDISDLMGLGVKYMLEELNLNEDKWLDLVSEAKRTKNKFFVKPDREMAITILAVQLLTGYDYYRIIWNGVAGIIDELIQTGKLKDLDEFGTKREIARQMI